MKFLFQSSKVFTYLLLTLPLLACTQGNANPSSTSNTSPASSNTSNAAKVSQETKKSLAQHAGEDKAQFIQPLAKDKVPTTDILYDEKLTTWQDFKVWLITEARKQHFSQRVISQLNLLNFNPRVVKSDRSQYERVLENRRKAEEAKKQAGQETKPAEPKELNLMQTYLNRHFSQVKVDRAVALLRNYKASLTAISEKYQVPVEVIVGLWGLESNFGTTQGKYDLLDSLASLAYEGRRRAFYTREFFNALRVMELNDFHKDEMKSSWAGAVGQTQFMPTSYLVYGADGSNDGRVNIWDSALDSFASIANYLHSEGWNNKLPWGVSVEMSYADYPKYEALSGTNKPARTLKEWQALGLELKTSKQIALNQQNLKPDTKLWLVIPTHEPAQAHLVTNNYNVYMHWNRSMYFAFVNGYFSDEIYQRMVEAARYSK